MTAWYHCSKCPAHRPVDADEGEYVPVVWCDRCNAEMDLGDEPPPPPAEQPKDTEPGRFGFGHFR